MNHSNDRKVKIIITVDFKFNEGEKHQLVLSRIGKDEKIRKEALEKFENLERIKEIKKFAEAEAKRRKVELSSVEFNKDDIKVIILLKSKNRLKYIELYIFAHLFFLMMDEKLPEGVKINENSVFVEYIV